MHVDHPVFRPRAALGATLGLALLSLSGEAALAQMQQHTLPLVLPDGMANQGFVRIINRSDTAGTVTIHATDDAGVRFGPITFDLAANATRHLNSRDLEQSNPGKGLSAGLGNGEGDWRLELTTELDIEPLAYIRTSAGFLTSMHDVVQPEYIRRDPRYEIDEIRYVVRFFNPGSNENQVSRLRVINRAGVDTPVIISAVDDRGESAPGGEVRLTLGPYEARTFSSQQLEEGDDDLEGMLGSVRGKWQLVVAAERLAPEERRYSHPIQVMSLLWSRASGNLTNLSSIGEGNDANRGGPDTDWLWGGAGDDVLNPGDNPTTYDSVYGSAGNDTIVYTDSSPAAFQWLGYLGIGTGIVATIDGTTNEGTVDKGSNGTDTILDIANSLDAAAEAPYGGFGLGGTAFDDEFDLTLADGQWMTVRGEEGNDTIRIHSGRVMINYWNTANGVEVDLEAGRANDDGHGTVDTFIGDVYQVEGGLGDDTLLGRNDGRDRLNGGPGDDTINPRDSDWEVGSDSVTGSPGNDRIVLSDSTGPRAGLTIEYPGLESSGITVTINGPGNRATVDKGADGVDTIVDIENVLESGGLSFEGSRLDDVINITVGDGHWTQASGDAGNDTFNFQYEGSGAIRLNYAYPRGPNGIDVDLAAGRANDDGFGDVDTFVSEVREIRGTDLDDVIRGSANDETFIGRRGNDTIDGRGGYDRLRFDRSGIGNVSVDLREGTAEGTWGDGPFTYFAETEDRERRVASSTFSYTIANIERVQTGGGDDKLAGAAGDDRLEGKDGDDELYGRAGNDRLYGGDGDDRLEGGEGDDRLYAGNDDDTDFFFFEPGHGEDRIYEFRNGDDIIVLIGLGVTKAQVLENAHAWSEGVGVWIDLSPFGGGTISIDGLPRSDLDESDFLL